MEIVHRARIQRRIIRRRLRVLGGSMKRAGRYLLDVKVTGRNILSDVGDTYNVFVPCLIKAGTTVTLITNGVESDGGNIFIHNG